MNDHEDHAPDPFHEELTDADALFVSDLLARAAEVGPMPDPVVARLDDLLAELAAERGNAGGSFGGSSGDDAANHDRDLAPVVPLAGRRRGPRLLLAAAAVVVAGVAGTAALDRVGLTPGTDESASDAGSGAALDDAGGDALGAEGGPELSPGSTDGGIGVLSERAVAKAFLPRDNVELTEEGFEEQVDALLGATAPPTATTDREGLAVPISGCITPPLLRGDRWSLVLFEGEPAALVTGVAQASGILPVTAYSCSDGTFLAFAEVTAP